MRESAGATKTPDPKLTAEQRRQVLEDAAAAARQRLGVLSRLSNDRHIRSGR
ncbi:MAG TPA: hypothetical protein VH092_31545 [Urbifossiella sp.]|jgi:hypothetical protein|nr:hypothetical protein [Urbifossiella sp.]